MTISPTCLLSCVRFLPPPDDITYSEEPRIWDDPPNIDMEPLYQDEIEPRFWDTPEDV